MVRFRVILSLLCGLFSISSLAASELYVSTSGSDSNSGTQSAPLRTIQKASSLATAGTTVHVAPGTYNESLTTNSSGTSSAPIRYISDSLWGAKVVASCTGYCAAWHNNGDYVHIIGFDITGGGALGINHSGSGDVASHNHVHHIPASACDGYGGAGIGFDNYNGKSGFVADSNLVHDIGPLGTNCYRVQGIYPSIPNGTISNNIIYRVVGYAVNTGHNSYNSQIVNNTMFANGGTVEGGGIVIAPNDFSAQAAGFLIANNIIYDNVLGIHEEGSIGKNTYTNNLVYANKTNWGSMSNTHGNDVSADPQFVNYVRAGGGDYHLKSASPAIDKGSASVGLTLDYEGMARPQGAAFDIGAYEFGSSAPAPSPAPSPSPAPVISISPTSLNFGSVLVGSSSSVQIISVTNTGGATLNFNGDFSLAGSDFAFGNLGTCGLSLAPASTCTASLIFTPSSTGVRTGSLTINDNAAGSPHIVQISGTGASPAPAASASVSPTSLSFGKVRVGKSSSVKYVTITNTGNSVLTFGSDSISGDFVFGNLGTCDISLAVGASCTYSAKFTPKATGYRSGAITIYTNASSTPLKVSLSGKGY